MAVFLAPVQVLGFRFSLAPLDPRTFFEREIMKEIHCYIIGKTARDGQVLSHISNDMTSGLDKAVWVQCMKWNEGCRKCEIIVGQEESAEPVELHE